MRVLLRNADMSHVEKCRVDISHQMEKNNKKYQHTHPAFWQSWDTLVRIYLEEPYQT